MKLRSALMTGLIAVLLAQLLQSSRLLDQWEYSTWSWRVKLLAQPSAHTQDIKIILLDQASLDWGASVNGLSWPWPREVYAPVIRFMQRAGAKIIAFDVLYTEASIYGVDDDQVFADAMAGNKVVLPVFLGEQARQTTRWPDKLTPASVRIEGLEHWQQQTDKGGVNKTHATFPLQRLANAATLLAHVDEAPDADGVFRRASLFRVFDQKIIPSMGLAALLLDRQDLALSFDGALHYQDTIIPIDNQGQLILKFRGDSGTHQAFSAAAIIQSELNLQAGEPSTIDPALFKNKYVFFGFSAPGLKDLRPTPVSGDYPGVEVHATVLDNLLAGDAIKTYPPWLAFAIALILACSASYLLVHSKRMLSLALVFVVFTPLSLLIGFVAYWQSYDWPVLFVQAAVVLALVNSVILKYLTEGREKRAIQTMFQRYLSKDYIEILKKNPQLLRLGGETRELSIFFSDIQGFTTISEKLTPEQLVHFLNSYLTDMTDIITDEGGTLDKYEGDAIIAFTNAPLPQDDHAVRMCRSVLKCQRKLAERRDAFFQQTGAWIYNRIGVHSGTVVVGNFGSKTRFNYTMLGDAANLAARLEGANKFFGTYTMISEATKQQTGDAFLWRETGTIRVVGRKTPVTVYELLGFKGEQLPPAIQAFNQAQALYKRGELTAAAAVFATLPNDPAAQVYLQRCLTEKDSVGPDWDGVWVLHEK
ncbi:MAG: adenylate/guanylate cyclase domain-containing protein [Methylobacter sp.]|nr:adenylate/guanylate cyclase domain-containing protein [Methylobacter sp.]MDP2099606.1 adenylate/guanylate cyclase domain-containing protein [Methylobacter sp.]MDP2429802.1 adenylate/guanylate cyclase domain-containing protein [Methylobacter sp.]MDP3055522.1 adenylate/guanylate cyclase domain-containing protein [Methylobacter sp.]MDP3363396.1 adenylate/guanylate cyclase domain-containing protein [Methylobacter sp.]